MRLLLVLAAAAALFAADRSGPFLSGGMGIGTYNDGDRPGQVQSRDVVQYRIGAGAFINKYFSVALDYGHFETFEGRTRTEEKVQQNFSVLTADVSCHYSFLEEQLDLFATFGAGEIFWEEKGNNRRGSSAATLVYGAGIGVRPLPWLTFNAGYDVYQFGMDDNEHTYEMSLGSAYFECEVQF